MYYTFVDICFFVAFYVAATDQIMKRDYFDDYYNYYYVRLTFIAIYYQKCCNISYRSKIYISEF